uniref:GIY-YIG domain-containing protein n=1 Tax=Rhabditophanes sp. KR3021 TaxID=114890 RepID=A0AC35TJA8_9BILA
MEKLKKARARKTSNKKQYTYVLFDAPTGVDLDKISLTDFKELIFYVGVSGIFKNRLQQHASQTRRDIARYIPLDPKSKGNLEGQKKVVAVYLDDLRINQALGLEYAIMFDMRHELTDAEDSAQSSDVS